MQMNLNRKRGNNFFIGGVCFILIVATISCAERADEELSFTNPYAKIIGAEYRIAGDVDAYGIYRDLNKRELSYITLIPGVGIGGPEVAFRKRIVKGKTIKILSAWREHKFFYSNIDYLVAIQDADLPGNVPVHLVLSRGNEGVGAELNPSIYEKVTK
jgi:hypothetical protein